MHSGANKTSQRVKSRCAIVAVRPRKRLIAMMVGWLPWGCAACDAFQPGLFPSLDQKLSFFAWLALRPAWPAFRIVPSMSAVRVVCVPCFSGGALLVVVTDLLLASHLAGESHLTSS